MKTKLLFSTLLSFYFCLLSSQVPQGFTYQAIATDAGHPITTAITVRITIQSDSITPVTTFWVEDHSSVTPNESGLFTLVIGKGTRISGSVTKFSDIDWSVTPKFIMTKINYGGWKTMGSARLWSVPYSMVAGVLSGSLDSLEISGKENGTDDALFEVKNKFDKTVFAVYNEGVRVYVDNGQAKSAKGGFAIGGFGTKGDGQEYLRVDPGIINLYIDDKTKSAKGGFAIGGFGSKTSANFFNVQTADVATTIKPSENRILWYPYKNAFFAGKVLIESAGDVGENSFATGFESKAKGGYSQAMGFQSVTIGPNSTAIGNNTLAEGPNSFAMGYYTKSSGNASTAMGSQTWAQGDLSTTMGYGTHTIGTGGTALGYSTTAKGDYSTAMGVNTTASGASSLALGSENLAIGDNSTVMGYQSKAGGYLSTAIGYQDTARNTGSVAIGYMSSTSGDFAVGMGAWNSGIGTASAAIGGYGNEAHGDYSFVTGEWSKTHGTGAFASGFYANASGNYSQAFGDRASAVGPTSTAFGWLTSSTGTLSVAMGDNTTAQSYASLVIGRYNEISGSDSWQPGEPAFVIGIGSDDSHRSNAVTVLKNGNVGIGISNPQSALHIKKQVDNGHLVNINNTSTASGGKGIAIALGNTVISGTYAQFITFFSSSYGEIGSISANASNNGIQFNTPSDMRLKENIINSSYSISDLMKIKVRDFNFKNDNSKTKVTGFIAQELYDIFPEAVRKPADEKNYWGVDYSKVTPIIVKAVQDQQEMINELKEQNIQLKAQNENLKQRLEKIEALLVKNSTK